MFDVIAFDADDTLWYNEPLYIRAKEDFVALLSKRQPQDVVRQRLEHNEVTNLDLYGYGLRGFILTMLETAVQLSDAEIDSAQIAAVLELGRNLLSTQPQLVEDTEATLNALSAKYVLMLITKGDPFEQSKKLDRSGLARHFRYIEILPDKSKNAYREVLEKHRISPARFLMVGNSLRSDILPVMEIGGQAVYIPYALTWAHENQIGDQLAAHSFFTLERLSELPEFLRQMEKQVDPPSRSRRRP